MPGTGKMLGNFVARWIHTMAWLVDLMIILRRLGAHFATFAGSALDLASMMGIYYCCRDQELWWALAVTPFIAGPWLLIKAIIERRTTSNTIAEEEDGRALPPPPPTLKWLNSIIDILWRTHRSFVNEAFTKKVWPEIRKVICKNTKIGCAVVDLKDFDIGSFPPKILRVHCNSLYTSENERELLLEMDIAFNSDASLTLTGLAIPVSIGNVEARIEGLCLLLERLSPLPPFVGDLKVFLTKEPDINWDTGGMAKVTDIPIIESLVDYLIEGLIRARVVLPNCISLELPGMTRAELKKEPIKKKMTHKGLSPIFLGLVQVTVIEAKEMLKTEPGFEHWTLDNEDPLRFDITDLLPKTKAGDTHVLVKLADVEHKSQTVKGTLNPRWNFSCEFLVDISMMGARLEVMVCDEDKNSIRMKSGDIIGKVTINLTEIRLLENIDMWHNLEGNPGKIHLKLRWIPFPGTSRT